MHTRFVCRVNQGKSLWQSITSSKNINRRQSKESRLHLIVQIKMIVFKSIISTSHRLKRATTCLTIPKNTGLLCHNQWRQEKTNLIKKERETEKDSLLMKIKVMPPFCMLSQLVSPQPSERSFQKREIT